MGVGVRGGGGGGGVLGLSTEWPKTTERGACGKVLPLKPKDGIDK